MIENININSSDPTEIASNLEEISKVKVLYTPDGVHNWIFSTDELIVEKIQDSLMIHNYVILDTYKENALGGTGEKFNWNNFRNSINTTNVFSSGGLNPENILGLLKNFNPFGIDIASGVETEGKKDPEKIKRIVKKENFLFYKDEIEQDYSIDSWNKIKAVVDKVKNKNLGPIAIKNEIKKYNIDPDIIEESIKAVGGELGSSVSKNTFVLLVKSLDETTGKIEQEKNLDVPIMTPNDFALKYI